MTDIVTRLRDPINQDIPFTELMLDAAARIEQLENALREIERLDDEPKCCGRGIGGYTSPPECCGDPEHGFDRAQSIARAEMGDEDE